MSRDTLRCVPTEAVILALTERGISRATAMQMNPSKAAEVLDLLAGRPASIGGASGKGPWTRDTLGTR